MRNGSTKRARKNRHLKSSKGVKSSATSSTAAYQPQAQKSAKAATTSTKTTKAAKSATSTASTSPYSASQASTTLSNKSAKAAKSSASAPSQSGYTTNVVTNTNNVVVTPNYPLTPNQMKSTGEVIISFWNKDRRSDSNSSNTNGQQGSTTHNDSGTSSGVNMTTVVVSRPVYDDEETADIPDDNTDSENSNNNIFRGTVSPTFSPTSSPTSFFSYFFRSFTTISSVDSVMREKAIPEYSAKKETTLSPTASVYSVKNSNSSQIEYSNTTEGRTIIVNFAFNDENIAEEIDSQNQTVSSGENIVIGLLWSMVSGGW